MFFRRKKTDGADPRERALWGELTSFGMTFSLCIVLGFFLGRWIGGLLGHRQWRQSETYDQRASAEEKAAS